MLAVSRNFSWEEQCKRVCQNYWLATGMLKKLAEAKAEGLRNNQPDPKNWLGWSTAGVQTHNETLNKHKVACCRMAGALQGKGHTGVVE